MERPNVLLFHTDQQRWDTIRAAGNPHIVTPNLDQLVSEGVYFENAFCNCPVCMPSRHSLFTGQYPSSLGICTNGIELPEDSLTLYRILKPYGYHAANIGKLHFKCHSNRDHRVPHPTYGFDTLICSDEPGCYDDAYIKWVEQQSPSQVENCRCMTPPAYTGKPTGKHGREVTEPYLFEGPEDLTHSAFVADEMCRFLQRHQDETFFAVAGFYAPHAPLNPPQRFVDMYDSSSLPLPFMNEGENRHGLSDEEWQKVKAYYYALISHVDDQLGKILKVLDETRLRERTLILFTSDHGEHLGDHGHIQKGPPGFDSCSRVPLIVSWPGRIPCGTGYPEIIEGVDLAPTILDYCGVQVPPIFQGRSFRPLLEGRPYKERPSAFIEWRNPFQRSFKSIRTHHFFYSTSNSGGEILFDQEQDPRQLRNVSGEGNYAGLLQEARAELLCRWFDVEKQYPLRTGAY